jgi:hypothetical protein
MALIKEMILNSGVTTNYHRIVSVNNITNHASIIELASYTSKEKREEEKTALENKEPMNVFISSKYLPIPYNQTLNVDSAYEYLKTLPEFSNSADDL